MTTTLLAAAHDHASMNHFAMGMWLLYLAYAVSVIGSIVGLACTRRSGQATSDAQRLRWLAAAAVSIGGVGIWLMHFIAMMGFAVPGSTVRYDLGWTFASAVLSICATFVGLVVVGRTVVPSRLLAGGVVMGLAVNLMHYTGMWALRIQGEISYDPKLVLASIAIAIIAATAALWFTLVLESMALRVAAGFVMGVAVAGMHYTGMAAVRVRLDPNAPVPDGLDVFSFVFPIFVIGLLAMAVPITAVMMAGEADEEAADEAVVAEPAVLAEPPAPEPVPTSGLVGALNRRPMS